MKNQLLEALGKLLSGNSGCPMCDSGRLRNPQKDHWDDCVWVNAKKAYDAAIKEPHGWRNAKTTKPTGTWTKHEWQKHLSEDVLLLDRTMIHIGRWNREKETWEVDEPADENWIEGITHWMPLPDKPLL